jgi:hypothetical protein
MAEKRLPGVSYIFENCLGCKWTLRVLDRIRSGVKRPGRLEKAIPGIATKVLGELTSFGKRLSRILDSVERLHGDVARGRVSR